MWSQQLQIRGRTTGLKLIDTTMRTGGPGPVVGGRWLGFKVDFPGLIAAKPSPLCPCPLSLRKLKVKKG